MSKVVVAILLLGVLNFKVMAAPQQQVEGHYHLTIYSDQQGLVSDIELFTKQERHEVFFGVTCSSMSPFPLVQVLLFNDDVVSEMPRFLRASYLIDGQKPKEAPKLQGILKPVDTFEEYSNKIRLELEPDKIRSLSVMNQGYAALLNSFKSGENVEITVESGAIGTQKYEFSLKGFKALIEPYESVCQ
ncbi:MAG: hypothetical protein U9R28_10315 [Pseudomonadota bacterium]|nr:hypothetical protein [Pseudomonadota bacterium]